mgnify:CR=1 FL=1
MKQEYKNTQQYTRKTIDSVMKVLPSARKMGFGDEYVTEVAKYAGGSTEKVFPLYDQRSSEMMSKGLTPLDLAKAAHNIGHIETNYADRLAFVALIPAADTAELAKNGAIEDIVNRNTMLSEETARQICLSSHAPGDVRHKRKDIEIALSDVPIDEMARIGRRYDPYNMF